MYELSYVRTVYLNKSSFAAHSNEHATARDRERSIQITDTVRNFERGHQRFYF